LVQTFLGLDAVVNLFTMHSYFTGRIYAYPYLVPLDSQNRNRNFVADHQGFPDTPR
jgi:hypothetical protein